MLVTTINGSGGTDPFDVMVHKAGCADIKKAVRRDNFPHESWTEEIESKRAYWLHYNSDFLEEGGEEAAWPMHFYPCTAGLPEGGYYGKA